MSNRTKARDKKQTRAKTKIAVTPEQDSIGISTSDEVCQDTPASLTRVADHPAKASDQEKIDRLDPDSLAARWLLEKRSVIRELHHAYVAQVIFYTKPEGGNLSMEEAIKKAGGRMDAGFDLSAFYDQMVKQPPSSISWYQIEKIFRHDPAAAQIIWEDIKGAANADFKSGHMAAEVFEKSDWQRTPWKRARFIAIRDSFVDQFKPQGGIDYSMIDMLAVTYAMWMHWSEIHIHRATTAGLVPMSKGEKELAAEQQHEWIPPRVYEQQAIEQAAQLADRWRRAYQSTLRQMRDWRRYNTPVTINNPRQVNIAADGGQQVNMQSGEGED